MQITYGHSQPGKTMWGFISAFFTRTSFRTNQTRQILYVQLSNNFTPLSLASARLCPVYLHYCAKRCTLQRKSHLCIPFIGKAGPQTQFPNHVSVSDLYSPRSGLHISSSRIGGPMVGRYKSLTDA
jgi:hypothetical protein